jgi:hypothetical protein
VIQKANRGKHLTLDIKPVILEARESVSPMKHFDSSQGPANEEKEVFLIPQDAPMKKGFRRVPSLSLMDGYQNLSQDA